MILEGLAQRLAKRQCPDCGTEQPIYTKAGFKSRIRAPYHMEPCANCGAELHLVYAPGGQFREGLGWGMAVVVLMGLAMIFVPVIGTPGKAAIWIYSGLGAVGLYLFAIIMTGLIVGWTRRIIKP